MTVYQAIGFKLPPARRADLVDLMHAIPAKCTRDGRRYVGAVRGGKQMCMEGLCQGMDLVFTVEFENADDYDYYLNRDPAHLAIKDDVLANYGVEGIVVWGFVPRQY